MDSRTNETLIEPTVGAGQQLVGWRDDEGIYLLGEAAYHEAQEYLRREGSTLDFSLTAIYDQLERGGLVVRTGGHGKATVVKKIRGKAQRVLHLRPDALDPGEEEADEVSRADNISVPPTDDRPP